MRLLVSGASGLIGSAVVAELAPSGVEIVRLVRREPRDRAEIRWDPGGERIDVERLEGFDAVIHLAGENLAAHRWTRKQMTRLWNSRVLGTRLLSETLTRAKRPPRVLIQASAVGYYGDRGNERLDESSAKGAGFLADLTEAWEQATAIAAERGIRVVSMRQGLVLSARGGTLARLLVPFRLGLGGPIGRGRAWWSWISIEDVVGIIRFAIDEASMRGPINVTSPEPVRNAEFARTLGRVIGRPSWMPVPPPILRLIFGKMADEAVLSSARVEPAMLLRSGYSFREPELEMALRRRLGRDRPRSTGH